MKTQLESLANELITEIKDIKDLAKQEIPLVAKEYVNYNLTVSVIGFSISVLAFIITCALIGYGYVSTGETKSLCYYGATGIGVFAVLGILCAGENYLSFKLQPRRMAILAITKLF